MVCARLIVSPPRPLLKNCAGVLLELVSSMAAAAWSELLMTDAVPRGSPPVASACVAWVKAWAASTASSAICACASAYERALVMLRETLDANAVAAAWQEARATGLE